ncbi:acyltransferase [Maribacter sp. 2-571]|uniref:acyltransferase n=1 Tax=Maribacter sp. 2-571 TaxID=3417569 RepID=UPI003D33A72A
MIQVLKSILTFPSQTWNGIHNAVMFRFKRVFYAARPKITGKIYIYKTGKVVFGTGVSINSGATSNPIGGDTRTNLIVSQNAVLTIGDHTGLSNCTIVCQNGVTIGKHVKIGGSVKIYDTDFHHLKYTERENRKTDIPLTKSVVIGDHCFIGAHSIILKGVTIGNKAIIGAGSVVTKSIPEGEVWGGNPAKFIKKIDAIG